MIIAEIALRFHHVNGGKVTNELNRADRTGAGSARGESGDHARDITIRGLKLTGAALSYLSPHGLPSDGGGDWALSRTGAVQVEGAENTLVEGCLFERIDGNGVMISGYNRNTSIVDNEFHLVGENGVVSWGYTADFPDAKRAVPIPKGQGPDATDGNHPQGSNIVGNFCECSNGRLGL